MNEQVNSVVTEDGLNVPAFLKREDKPLDGPVLGEFVQTEDEVGKEVLAQEIVN